MYKSVYQQSAKGTERERFVVKYLEVLQINITIEIGKEEEEAGR